MRLGESLTQRLQMAGLEATHRRGLGGTHLLWEALLRGEIDLYPEYTGTLERELLDQGEQLPDLGLGVSAPLGFSNPYALGIRRERARQLGLRKISQLVQLPELSLGMGHEFLQRKDGWNLLQRGYDLPQRRIYTFKRNEAFSALKAGHLDLLEVFATDPEVRRQRLLLLEDDRRLFPSYQAVILYRLKYDRLVGPVLSQLEHSLAPFRVGAASRI